MWPHLVLVFFLLFVFVLLLTALLPLFIIIGVNCFLLYLAGLRIVTEVRKGHEQEFAISGVISAIILFWWGNILLFLWGVTTFVLQWLLFGKIVQWFEVNIESMKKRHLRSRSKLLRTTSKARKRL